MVKFGETNSGTIEKTNEEIEARLIRRARRRALRASEREKLGGQGPTIGPEPAAKAQVSIYSFAELSRVAQNVPLPSHTPEVANPSPTIEKLIAELIRTPLSKWLHDNLPPMVERMVQEEVNAQSRDWLTKNLPSIVERVARETLRDMLSRASRQKAA